MKASLRFQSVAAFALTFAAPGLAFAEPTDSGLKTVDPKTQTEARAPEAPPVEAGKAPAANGGSTHVFDAYRLHADSVFVQRMAGGTGALVVGGTLIALGVVATNKGYESFGIGLYVGGGITAAGGLLAFVFPSEVENVANANGVYATADPSPEQEAALEREWQRLADKARTGRKIGAAVTFVFAGAMFIGGAYVLASNSVSQETKNWAGPTLIASGGATAAGGVLALFVETPTETSYAAFAAARGKGPGPSSSILPNVRVSAQPLEGGGFIRLGTNF